MMKNLENNQFSCKAEGCGFLTSDEAEFEDHKKSHSLTEAQIKAAKDRFLEECASAIENVVHESWITLETRCDQMKNIAKQLKEAQLY